MIEVKDLLKTYLSGGRKMTVVDNVSFSVAKGEMVSVAGHSGSGKTTLMSLVGGLTRPDSGSVIIGGKELWTMEDDGLAAFRNSKIGFIYQFSSLIPTLTAIENVLLPTAFGKGTPDSEEYARELLSIVRLEDRADAYPSQLSGGQQRRIAIARAFINRPEIILADEPTGDLDEENEAEMMGLFRKMNIEQGITFLLVTHSSELAGQTGRRFRMSNGKLSDEGVSSPSSGVPN